jgi:hypothetical protein
VLSERDRRMLEEIERGLCAADPRFVQRFRAAVAHTMESIRAARAGTAPTKGRVGTGPSLPAVGLAVPGGVVVTTLDARVRGTCGTLCIARE